jgi:hypothetical protein
MGDMAGGSGYSAPRMRRILGHGADAAGTARAPPDRWSVGALVCLAEDRGFEPLRAFTQHAFQACAIGH